MRQFPRQSARVVLMLCGISFACHLSEKRALANPAVYEPATDPGLGFNLIAWSGNNDTIRWINAINTLHAAGFREVSISPVRRFDYNTGAVISNFGYPSLTAVEAGVNHAKLLGMRVTLNPFMEFSNLPASAGGWRANFAPLPGSSVANTFWPLYESYLDDVATMGQAHDVDAMNVGTEYKGLDSFYSVTDFDLAAPGNQTSPSQGQLDQQAASWDTIIDSVASIFSGQIGYAANWDNFDSSRVTNNIWSHPDIDYIGIDSYFRFQNGPYVIPSSQSDPIQTYPNENFTQLVADEWNQRLDEQIMPFAAGIGKPVVFTEQGYQPHNGSSRNPQNESGAIDSAEQIMAFQGLLRALDGRKDDFLAMHIWQWSMSGSEGSTWNIDPTLPANQPDNLLLGQWLSGWVQNQLAGDFNRDGTVDAADYTVWRDSLGQLVANYHAADGDGDGRINDGDYAIWRTNFGAPFGGAATSSEGVPEPATLGLSTLVWIVILVRRPRRRAS